MTSKPKWIPAKKLDRKQLEVYCLPENGHCVVLGTAGSGKSIMAVHRAIYLASPEMDHGGPTLIITFNKCLVTYLRHLKGKSPGNITIENYHKFARGYLNSRNKMRHNCIAQPDLVKELCTDAWHEARRTFPNDSVLERPVNFFIEERQWIAQHGIADVSSYHNQKRTGQSSAKLSHRDYLILFKVYKNYLRLRSKVNKDYDWDDLSLAVLRELNLDSGKRRYQHIVIDEGQDLSPMQIKSLCAAVPSNGSVTFFGDVAQRIYNHESSWRAAELDIELSRVWRFEQNYRNTPQIARLALAVANMPCFTQDPDIVVPSWSAADGALPSLVNLRSEHEELHYVARLAQYQYKTQSVAVLFRDRQMEKDFANLLECQSTRLRRNLRFWPTRRGLFHGTYHSAKGLEFDTVILPKLSRTRLPRPRDEARFGRDSAMARAASLLYVGITRARTTLILTYTGRVTRLLPDDATLYTVRRGAS